MNRFAGISLPLLAASLVSDVVLAGVDLTPRYIDTFAEGVSFRRPYFTVGEKKIVVSLNRETEVVPEAGGALFRFTKLPEANFRLLRSRHPADHRFEGAALERYRESARRLVPMQATGTAIKDEQLYPYPINDWKSYRFTLSFELNQTRHLQSVTFLNLNASDQIMLITTAPEKEFVEAMHRSHQIIRSWQEMLPGDEKPASSN